jgi:hypothetical protein
MTSKQRVIAELEHREPDRVPTGEFATDYPIIEQLLGREAFWRGKAKMIKALFQNIEAICEAFEEVRTSI